MNAAKRLQRRIEFVGIDAHIDSRRAQIAHQLRNAFVGLRGIVHMIVIVRLEFRKNLRKLFFGCAFGRGAADQIGDAVAHTPANAVHAVRGIAVLRERVIRRGSQITDRIQHRAVQIEDNSLVFHRNRPFRLIQAL